jgi:Uri superfamily endonuclease
VHRITDNLSNIYSVKSGIYLLEIKAATDFQVNIKKFKGVTFPAGYFYYVGSAQKNFGSRIRRHLSADKTIHWHIDHITTVETNRIKKIYFIKDVGRYVEIDLADKLMSKLNCKVIVEKFGSSDTPESITHLVYSRRPLSYSHLTSLYQSIVRFIPSSSDT